jgi:hypothetical protein
MYSITIIKDATSNGMMVAVIKNGVIIDAKATTSPNGSVTLEGDCTNPDIEKNLGGNK